MMRVSNISLRKRSSKKALEARLKDIDVDSHIFLLFRNIIDEIIKYYGQFKIRIKELNQIAIRSSNIFFLQRIFVDIIHGILIKSNLNFLREDI